MRRILAALLASALTAPARADVIAPATPLPAPPKLTVGVPEGAGPEAGFDRALFTEVAREAGLTVSFAASPPGVALVDLDSGRVDVAAGPYPPSAAAGRRALSPVLAEGDALLKRRGDGMVRVPADAAGKRLGLLGPPAGAARLIARATALRARVAARPGAFGRDPERELLAGRVAALLGALPDVAAVALALPDAVETIGPPLGFVRRLAPLVRADRPALAARLEAALGRLRANGALADLQRRWFGLAFDAPDPPQSAPVSTSRP